MYMQRIISTFITYAYNKCRFDSSVEIPLEYSSDFSVRYCAGNMETLQVMGRNVLLTEYKAVSQRV